MGLLLDEGQFFGVQDGSRSIGICVPKFMDSWQTRTAAKLVFIVSRRENVTDVLVDGDRATSFPYTLSDGALIVFGFEQSLLAIKLLSRTDLGRNAPIQLIERDGDLLLEIYNYKGSAKTFWELAQPGSFYQGQPQCGFFAEAAECSNYESIEAFADVVSKGELSDEVEDAVDRFSRNQERKWRVAYNRDGKELGIEVDLIHWKLLSRWNNVGPLKYPLLESRNSVQRMGGDFSVGAAKVGPCRGSVWLYGNDEARLWVLGGYSDEGTKLAIETPTVSVTVSDFRFGQVLIQGDRVSLDANEGAWVE